MKWKSLCKQRTNCFGFSREAVGKEKIKQALDALHTFMPSQNEVMPMQIDYYDFSDWDFRRKIFDYTWTPESQGTSLPNPQVLAPEILIFSNRVKENNLEIGMAAMFLAYQFTSIGIDYGFCNCYDDRIHDLLGHRSQLIIGIGYSSGETYYNPFTEELEKTPVRRYKKRRPKQNEYIGGLYA
jgi:hypothetical protein